MSTSKQVTSAMHSVIGQIGARRKGNTWFLSGNEVISALNLQKSGFGGGGYLNVGFIFRQLKSEEPTKFSDCHIYCRASELIDPSASGLDWVEFNDSTPEETSGLEQLNSRIQAKIVPVLQKGTTLSGVYELVKGKVAVLMDPEAREFLERAAGPT